MSAATESSGPLQFAVAGEPVRRAVAVLEREQTRLVTALRLSLIHISEPTRPY